MNTTLLDTERDILAQLSRNDGMISVLEDVVTEMAGAIKS